MRKAIMVAVDSASLFSSDHPNLNKQLPSLSSEARISQQPSSHIRNPLQSRDQNVKMRVPPPHKAPLATKSANRKMVQSDKQHTVPRPFAPKLSVHPKPSNSNPRPLTPRVVGSKIQSKTTPQARTLSPVGGRKLHEDVLITASLNYNVTPRSGPRKSRINSTSSTPTSTPAGTPDLSSCNDSSWHLPTTSETGLKNDRNSSSRPILSARTQSDLESTKSSFGLDRDTKFIFADDVKAQPKSQAKTKSTSSFFYANGELIPSPPQNLTFPTLGSTAIEERSSPKFFHANGTPDFSPTPVSHFPPPRPGSALSFSSRMSNARFANHSSSKPALPTHVRPSSPRLHQYPQSPSPSSLFETNNRQQSGRGLSNIVNDGKQFLVSSHGRSSSCDTAGLILPLANKLYTENLIDPNLNFPRVPAASTSAFESVIDVKPISEPQSPTKTGNSLEQQNELAANARRERKVLDLEITNSSLAAINKTLEREMRKQSAELRRYKRLSRSGRLSIASSPMVHKTSLSDMSEDDEEEEEEIDSIDEYAEVSDDEASEDDAQSPHAIAKSDLRHRSKDEMKLKQDLAKHQQLLIDSQKMNHILKRCLGLTEELIAEGRKALQYKVAATDVELGGRVLVADEAPEDDNEGMSEVGLRILKEARLAALNERVSRVSTSKLEHENGNHLLHPREQTEAAGQLAP
ncbi:hypothetical protein K3495_g1501 [Podosphaera aphanis]|nr:hypothetical protein K3495_g1501 [Podosphaera aphanis]